MSESTGALTGRRLLVKEFQSYKWEQSTVPAIWDESKNDWVFGGGTQGWISSETYFDCSGYNRDDLTIFPSTISIQESGAFRVVEDAGGTEVGVMVLDMITEERVPAGDVPHTLFRSIVENLYNEEVAPGFSLGPLDFQQIIYGRYRMFAHDANIWTPTQGNLTLLSERQFGSGSPTTAAKLWCTRIIIPLGEFIVDPATFIVVPAARYILSATIGKEGDSQYLMRLKRSYELGTAD